MTGTSWLSREHLSLLMWETSFLPDPSAGEAAADPTLGGPDVLRWPRSLRLAVAVQALAAASFLLERGFYPERRVLRGARLTRRGRAVSLRLASLPRWRLDGLRLERRLQGLPGWGEGLLPLIVLPLLARLLPERRPALEAVVRRGPAWEVGGRWLGVLLAGQRDEALAHPEGPGRALWACRLAPLVPGVWWTEEEGPARRMAAALAAGDRTVQVVVGELDEEDVVRCQARVAATGRDAVVLTTLPLPAATAWGLDEGADALWVLAPRWELAQAHAEATLHSAGRRLSAVRHLLAGGAGQGFPGPPTLPVELPGRSTLATPAARRALAWLGGSPAGIEDGELEHLLGPVGEALGELERLGLALRRGRRWQTTAPARPLDRERLERLATMLPEGSGTRAAAATLLGGSADEMVAWSESRLDAGRAGEVLELAGALGAQPQLALLAAEAALAVGRPGRAEGLLEALPRESRGDHWHALHAWWAEAAGLPKEAATSAAHALAGSPTRRLTARCHLVLAALARQGGDRAEARARAEAAVSAGGGEEALLELTSLDGPDALRRLRRQRRRLWDGDTMARYLHLQGSVAAKRGEVAAACTAYRAALRATRANNLKLVGEIHLDLGGEAILMERPATAERHLLLAERLLERCGSRRVVTVARHNRGVLACDRLDWRQAQALIGSARELRGVVDDAAFWLEELELARASLARGDLARVIGQMPELTRAAARHADDRIVQDALASLRTHLALATGDLESAARAAELGEDEERHAVVALLAAARGEAPPRGLLRRWGLGVSVTLLAAWVRGEHETARQAMGAELERAPLEAAVGSVRALAVATRLGVSPEAAWGDLWGRVEAALLAGELQGWAEILRRLRGVDAAGVVAALDGVLGAGTDLLGGSHLAALARALGLPWLEVRDGSECLGRWGEPVGQVEEVAEQAIRVAGRAPLSALELAVLRLVARHVAMQRAQPAGPGALPAGGLLGVSPALDTVRRHIAQWAPLPVTVLIQGEPGTGKELVAREVHRQSGRHGAFVAVNCAGLPAALLEAELFGVARGAFTGADRDRPGLVEAAEDGTLFLDEVGELPLELQGKLLRLLQEREVRRVGATRTRVVDVRFVAATNRDLPTAVAAGQLRQDLYYRLAVAVIRVPPLRERPDDVEELARFVVHRCAAGFGRPGVRLAPSALEALRRGTWPGNVRELESAIARAVAAARPGEVLGADRFPEVATLEAPAIPELPAWNEAVEAFRRSYFTRLLEASRGNRSAAARRAGISRQTLLYHLRELGIR